MPAAPSSAASARGRFLGGHHHGERRCGAGNLAALILQHAQQVGLRAGPRIVGWKHVRRRTLGARLLDRPLGLQIKVAQEQLVVAGEIMQRGQHAGLLVVVVVALRPFRLGQRRILLEPGARVLVGPQRALFGVRAAVAERLVQAADAVVHGGDEHQVAGRPRVERAVREHAGHAELGHLRDVVPAHHLPFVGQNRVDPRVVRAVADGVVVEVRHGFVQVVQHLRLPADERVEDVARELQRQPHGVAIVIVRDVVAPVDQRRPLLAGVRADASDRCPPCGRARPPRRPA